MDNNRKTAYRVLLAMEEKGAYSNLELNSRIEKDQPDSPAFVREIVYGVTENRIYIDFTLDYFIKKGVKSADPKVLTLMRMAVYQVEFMDSVPEYAAINESVKLAKKFARGRDGFVNGVLRNYLRKRDQVKLPSREKDLAGYLSIKYSVHRSIAELWLQQMGEDRTERMLKWGNTRPELMIRVNYLKTTVEQLQNILENQGFQVTQSEICSRTLVVKGSGLLDIDLYRQGYFSVQDVTSTIAAEMLQPQPGDFVIDMCAAPGGKTACIAEIMENRGRIQAFDIYSHKVKLIDDNAKRLGITIIQAQERDSSIPFEDSEKADRVLCDVPCSGLGMIRQKPEIKFRAVENQGIELSNLQLTILENGAQRLKKGGRLVYSTCTLNYNENQKVIERFLRDHKDMKLVCEKVFSPEDACNGFFAAALEKNI